MNEPVDVLGLEHIYLTVSSLAVSEAFYDTLLVEVLGFRKSTFALGDEPHINYFNRHFGFVLRPARSATPHDNYAPGLHHLCLRVATEDDVVLLHIGAWDGKRAAVAADLQAAATILGPGEVAGAAGGRVEDRYGSG